MKKIRISTVLGKSETIFNNKTFSNNSLIAHCLAVSASAQAIFQTPIMKKKLQELGWNEDISWLLVLIALHDIGKCAPEFKLRIKVPIGEIEWDDDREEEYRLKAASEWNHGEDGFKRYCYILIRHIERRELITKKSSNDISDLLRAVCAHHNTYATGSPYRTNESCPSSVCVTELFDLLEMIITDGKGLPEWNTENPNLFFFQHWLAGWTTLADWLGSGENNFEPIPTTSLTNFTTIEDIKNFLFPYWVEYSQKAEQIIIEKSLFKNTLFEDDYCDYLSKKLAKLGYSLNPIQKWAEKCELPNLCIIEAPMGIGKTEIAMILTNRYIKDNRASGLIFALPTQSTANKIHDRLDKEIAEYWFGVKGMLIHGNAWIKLRQSPNAADNSSMDQLEWMSNSTKRAFLAPVAVCTIDQVQKLAMKYKHSQLRAAACAQRCLIIDEVHSYDAYMSRQIESVLEYAGLMNIPVILMSATLPLAIKKRFFNAYNRYKSNLKTIPFNNNYPCVTTDTHGIYHFPDVKSHNTHYRLKTIPHKDMLQMALAESQQGKTVGLICNSVDSAKWFYQKLKKTHAECILFHASFTESHRLEKEDDVIKWFGKESEYSTRNDQNGHGKIIIATQVAEQSIDFDVDVMFSELCPIDLLLQRAGRLQRHYRGNRGTAILYISVPDVCSNENNEPWFKITSLLYNQDILLKTFNWLGKESVIHLPCGISDAVNAIYTKDNFTDEELAKRQISSYRLFNWQDTIRNQRVLKSHETRLSDPSYKILMLIQNSQGNYSLPFSDQFLSPNNDNKEQIKHLLSVGPHLVAITDYNAPEGTFGNRMNALSSIIESPNSFWNLENARFNYDYIVVGNIKNGIFTANNNKKFNYCKESGLTIK